LHAQIPGLLWTLDEKTKKILKKTGETCPVIKSIHPDIKVNIDWAEWSGEERSEIL
jgi:uncharacterized OsmC-like protein